MILDNDLLQAARCEDLLHEQIQELTVIGEFERGIIEKIKQSGAHLLMGARGVGKSMLMKQAELELDSEFNNNRILAVYVNFKTSTLLEGVKAEERDAFQMWVGAKILQALHDKMIFLNLIGSAGISDPYYKIFGLETSRETKDILQEKIHKLQKMAMVKDKSNIIKELGSNFLDTVNDTSHILDIVKEIISEFNISRIIFLFDEAAHTFIPQQQEIFFEIFKLLHGARIAVKAAVYPTITSYGRNFEIGHDALIIMMDRFETSDESITNNRKLFRDMLLKRLPNNSSVKKKIFQKGELLDYCIDLSSGNPRAFLHILNKTLDKGYNERDLLLSVQDFVDRELLPYHNNLCHRLPKYSNHIVVGLELLKQYIIPEIKEKNNRERKNTFQSAFFTFSRDISPNLKLALDILCYSGILTQKGTVKISNRNTGIRYMVNMALMFAEKAFKSNNMAEISRNINVSDYREFGLGDANIEYYLEKMKSLADKCIGCNNYLEPNAKFCSNCGRKIDSTSIISKLLDKSVDELPIQNALIRYTKSKYPKIGDVIQASRFELMQIKYIKEVRSRIIKNAAEEFVSG